MPPKKRRAAEDAETKAEYRKLLQRVATGGGAEEGGGEVSDARISGNLDEAERLFGELSSKADAGAPAVALDASVIRQRQLNPVGNLTFQVTSDSDHWSMKVQIKF